MRIKEILHQNRRDFSAIFICPFCGYEEEQSGYDDANFHQNVIPKIECKKCGKTEQDGESYRPLTTKFPEGYQV
ncbi:MAG: hypothetical protein ACLUAK_06790 [Dialister invisus]|uniref:hypothetical protein n=1 Tax=Dialister invisus TaxID=218538 RepID=UPI002675A726|nr:hypothetical protein [Dialister invisus]